MQKLQPKKQESEVRKQAVKLNRFCQILEIIPWRSLQACQQSLERTYRMITVKVAVDVSLHSCPKDGLGVAYPKKPESNKKLYISGCSEIAVEMYALGKRRNRQITTHSFNRQ